MRDTQDRRNGERLQRGGRQWLHDGMEIAHVAWDVHRCDLARSFAVLVEAPHDPSDN